MTSTQNKILRYVTMKWKTACTGCLHDPTLPGCDEAFDVFKVAISCGTCLSKIVRSEYFKVI